VVGSMRDRFLLGARYNALANLDTANAKFAVRPFSGFQVTGVYTQNPEDPKVPGKINELTRREYGMAATLGALQLGGAYAINEFAATAADAIKAGAPQFGEYNFTLGLRLSQATKFTSSYKDTFFYGGALPRGLRIYTMGLTHNLGSWFNLTMGGTLTSDESTKDAAKRNNYKAEAKLGVKF
jgi:hypothetical protein